MSADAWRICPRCADNLELEKQKKRKQVEQFYGKVSPEEFLRLISEADDFDDAEPKPTFREDYEILMQSDGEFYVKYHGQCDVCNLTHEFKHIQQVYSLVSEV